MKEKEFILNKINEDAVKDFLAMSNINSCLVFGSILTDEFNEESDVDIAILASEKLKMKDVLKIERFFEDILEREIDVIDLSHSNLDIFIKINILNTGRVIYTSDSNNLLEKTIDDTQWYYKENETFFDFRRRDLIS